MSKNKKILLALDAPEICHILTQLLHSWGYKAISTSDGVSALNLVTKEFPDLIVVDASLPKLDGLEVARVLKEDFITAYIPIIVLIDKRQFRRNLLEIKQGIDDFLIKPPDPIDFEIRIALALRNAEHQFHANPLTKLPGNRAIERMVESGLKENKMLSFAYVDVNNFKAFNDRYGYIHGDAVIMQTAKILSTTVKKFGNKDDFVGHVGGDDFVFITTPDKEEIIAKHCIGEFDRLIPFHYNKEDRDNGFITVKDRAGDIVKFALMSISIAIANNKNQKIDSSFELAEIVSEIKRYLKTLNKSQFLINRRTTNSGIISRQKKDFSRHYFIERPVHIASINKPLGQLLVDARMINEEQLNEALNHHWKTGRRLGEVLVEMGFITPQELEKILKPKDHVLVK